MSNSIELEQFIQRHYTTICTIALKFVGSSDIARDIAQDVIVKFWENRKQYKTLDSVENFLFIMTRNESLNYIRSVKRENDRYKQIYTGEQDDSDILDKIIEEEANQILIHAIRQLPPQSERIIHLTLAGNNVKEIAELIGVSINTVRTLKYGAIRKLREYFIARNYRAEF
ncbi:RNA polymerase sigma factor [Butyricimonas sp. Marseille-P3923]|uniref:RNA polymerase sigma factor n=1 Tax=Butyricimonas sp. Marseille-P3923 TaxID=1987504 RepID=UPI000C075A84|nr:sigma-70 family RNA polymerase sigma factor [Butyricimonas sp. Marseille-P3923]